MLKQHPVNKENRLLVVGGQSVIAGSVKRERSDSRLTKSKNNDKTNITIKHHVLE